MDFVVIGGGPAGCCFAILAARSGASVLLVERDDYRRPRPGEHLAGRIRPLLDALGVPAAYGDGTAAPSVGILSLWNGGEEPLLKLYGAEGQATALSVVRQRFDELLFRTTQEAGATVLSRARASVIARTSGGAWAFEITGRDGKYQRYATSSVVDASGRSAAFARTRGSRRVNHGDLIAIVRWLDAPDAVRLAGEPLTVESCAAGWWSLSRVDDRTVVATLYTSSGMMKVAGATPGGWWDAALATTRRTRAVVVRDCVGPARATRVLPACPSLASSVGGDGWVAVGDAAVTLDPLGGQGVAFALETACRAFEAANVDPTWSSLGALYRDALCDRFAAHLAGRANVYAEAADVLPESFLRTAVGPKLALPTGAAARA